MPLWRALFCWRKTCRQFQDLSSQLMTQSQLGEFSSGQMLHHICRIPLWASKLLLTRAIPPMWHVPSGRMMRRSDFTCHSGLDRQETVSKFQCHNMFCFPISSFQVLISVTFVPISTQQPRPAMGCARKGKCPKTEGRPGRISGPATEDCAIRRTGSGLVLDGVGFILNRNRNATRIDFMLKSKM